MSAIERTLNTPEAYQAIGRGVVTLIFTKNLEAAIEAMLDEGRRNGALVAVRAAVVVDTFRALANSLNGKN